MTNYKFEIDQIVTHRYEKEMRGIISQQMTYGQIADDCDETDNTEPSYEVKWTVVPVDEDCYIGYEHEGQLLSVDD